MIKHCDYCNKEFNCSSSHLKRNKHFFCSKECSYNFKVKKLKVECLWCKEKFEKKRTDVNRTKRNFCSVECYRNYSRYIVKSPKKKIDGMAEYRDIFEKYYGIKLNTNDVIHHIDGNHQNNKIENLVLVNSHMHALIHSSEKERSKDGKFVKKRTII